MPSPMMTVILLVVLWLIVVVPMIVRRNDERRREKTVAAFGRGMRALGRRSAGASTVSTASPEVFVPRRDDASLPDAGRRPVPAAQEALMYPPDRSELSAARASMLARRRRSLGTLAGGTLLFLVLGVAMGGFLWAFELVFVASFAGYLWFLRSQALRDRSRRETRQARAADRHTHGWDATADEDEDLPEVAEFEQVPANIVRIDDDDIELQSMDTIDLTGLYQESLGEHDELAVRRAS